MKIRLLWVGKPRDALLIQLHDRYAERLTGLGVDYSAEFVPEVRSAKRFSDDHVRQRESAALIERLDPKETVVALDTEGQLLSSPGLAQRLGAWSARRATFIVGGPLGLHPDLLERAHTRWSLTPLTFPHELMRCLVAEQLYRAVTLIRRFPYHK